MRRREAGRWHGTTTAVPRPAAALLLVVLLAATVVAGVFALSDYRGVRQQQLDHQWLVDHGDRTQARVVDEGLRAADGTFRQYWATPLDGHAQYFVDATGSRTRVSTLGAHVTLLVGDRYQNRIGIPVDTTTRHFTGNYLAGVGPPAGGMVLLAGAALLVARRSRHVRRVGAPVQAGAAQRR